ncbi:citrate transporter-domain-containing protein [Cladochytrium replicatum]|nr:citrate transporter-domain-containing protein [Cladochytrium replicatum]
MSQESELPVLSALSYMTLIIFVLVVIPCVHPFVVRIRHLTIHINHATAPLIGSVILLATTALSFEDVWTGIVGDQRLKPYSVVLLVFALTFICMDLEVANFFRFVAFQVARSAWKTKANSKSSNNPRLRLFVYLYFFSALLTVIASNDAVVISVTPIICYIAETVKIDPNPYLMSMFFVINIASMTLYIGNPTNLIIAQAYSLSFLGYAAWMVLPTVAGVLVCFLASLLVFRNHLFSVPPGVAVDISGPIPSTFLVKDLPSALISTSALLLSCAAFFVVPLLIPTLEPWIIVMPFAGVVVVKDIIMDISGWTKRRYRAANGAEEPTAKLTASSEEVTDETLIAEVPAKPVPADEDNEKRISSEIISSSARSDSEPAAALTLNDGDTHKDSSGHAILQIEDDSQENLMSESADLGDLQTYPPKTFIGHIESALSKTANAFPILTAVLSRQPWTLIPFALGMFIQAEAISRRGWTARLSIALWSLAKVGVPPWGAVFFIAILSTLASNALNNLPMTIVFAKALLDKAEADSTVSRAALYGLVIGSNLGANVTFVGSLAGVIFTSLVNVAASKGQVVKEIKMGSFVRWCGIVTPWVLASVCTVMAAELIVIGP